MNVENSVSLNFKMAVDQDQVSKILFILSHPLRREILVTLSDRGDGSFMDLLNKLKIDTGKLSFHLRTLSSMMGFSIF